MNVSFINTRLLISLAALCACTGYSVTVAAQARESTPKEVVQPTGTTGATAFQPGGAARGEAEAGTAQNGNAGQQQPAKPGFDNKPAKGTKANCSRPQGGVDASGGENISTASKENSACTGKAAKKSKRN
jgi:hypothetical protein